MWSATVRLLLSIFFLVLVPPLTAGAQDPGALLGNHHDSPVFYEVHPTPYFLVDNKDLLHEDKLKLWHFPVADVTGWNWKSGGIADFSWWIQVEELRFLLPLLKSEEQEDRALARKWFSSWYESNRSDPRGNRARWREPMSAAYRGMVLVFFLKTEEARAEPHEEITAKLREVIHQHQEFLADPVHFDQNSNHGLVESFGLLEVTRVFPNTEYEILGLDRLLTMTERSVSALGTHKEHSPPYHFAFLNWLDRFSAYLGGKPYLDQKKVAELTGIAAHMRSTSYYMRDHDGIIPEVGDADSMNVSFRYPQYWDVGMARARPVFYDPEAGFAVYKGRRRYVLFAIQNERPELPFHYHNDVLSVYYRYNGETILGDPGKYQYTRSPLRRFFVSMPAHNTLFPSESGGTGAGMASMMLAESTDVTETRSATTYSGGVRHDGFLARRSVTIPRDRRRLTVVDVVSASRRWSDRHGGGGPSPVSGRSGRQATLIWNFGYDVAAVEPEAAREDGGLSFAVTTKKGRRLRLTVDVVSPEPTELTYELVKGRRDPLRGWYAPKLFVMRPSYTAVIDILFDETARISTRVEAVSREYPTGLRIFVRGY